MTFHFKGFHDFEGCISIVCRVGELAMCEIGASPVTCRGRFRFFEALLQKNAHCSTDPNLSPVSHFTEDLIKVEHVSEFDSQSIANLAMIVLKPESHFEDRGRGDQLR